MYIARINFLSKDGFIKAGEEVKNPSKEHLSNGLVIETKHDTKEVKPKKRRKKA